MDKIKSNINDKMDTIDFLETVNLNHIKHFLTLKDNELIGMYADYKIENNKEVPDKKKMMEKIKKARQICSQYLEIDKDHIKRTYKSKNEKRHTVRGIGIQGLPGFIRNYFCKDLYDHDIINSHPSVFLYLCKKIPNLNYNYLESYVNDRETILKNNFITKHQIISLINMDKHIKQKTPWLVGFCEEISTLKDILLNTIQHNFLPDKDKPKNPKSSVFSQILHKYETKAMKLVFKKYGEKISIPMYDGFLSKEIISIEELEETTSKYGLKWKHKDVNTDIEYSDFNELQINDFNFLKRKWEKEIAFIAQSNTFINIKSGIEMNETTIKNWASNWTCFDEDDKRVKFLPLWLGSCDRVCCEKMDFLPYINEEQKNKISKDIYNTFKPFPREQLEDINTTPIEFDEYLKGAFKEDDKIKYIIGYIAHLLQFPQELPETIIVMKGLEGSGKDSLLKLIGRLIGRDYVAVVEDINAIFGQFNETLGQKLVICLNEMDAKKFIPNREAVKNQATCPTNRINPKHYTPRIETNLVRIFILSNNYDPVIISPTDRRFVVLTMNDELVRNHEYWNGFYNDYLANDEKMDELYSYLSNYNLDNWKPKDRVITNELRQAQFNNIQPFVKFLYIELNKKIGDSVFTLKKNDIIIQKSYLLSILHNYYNECDYGYKKKAVSEMIAQISGITLKRNKELNEYYLIDKEKTIYLLEKAYGLCEFKEFFIENDED